MSCTPWDLYVFRETRRSVEARRLVDGLVRDVGAGRTDDALVRAGEIESAVADAGAPGGKAAMALTDALAASLLGVRVCDRARIVELARSLEDAGSMQVVPPESFSYYGLHPSDVAVRLASPPFDDLRRVAVVGLRSIGTTMSAVVCAAVRARGGSADRRTVRPGGAPYDRVTHLPLAEERWVRRQLSSGSHFVVVDEGPGLSGSSLLSVVDALTAAGVPREAITLLCTRRPAPRSLLARDADRRWSAVRVAIVPCAPRFPAGFAVIPPGSWRARFLAPGARWPGCWAWLERAKALSIDGRTLLKFEGLGRSGAEARARATAVADAGFGPRARSAGLGLVAYDVVGARRCAERLDMAVIDRIAEYCAWRALHLPATSVDTRALGEMVRTNAAVALGLDLAASPEVVRPVIADARMMPHEWVDADGGVLLKTDAASHGDDHLFPGPTDVAWDLAGAIVEWRMPRAAMDRLLDGYARRTGDRAHPRLPAWLLAYALHRLGWLDMAASATDDPIERARLLRESDGHRRWMRAAARLGLFGKAAGELATAA